MSEIYNPLNHSVVQALLKADGYQRFECPAFAECLLFRIKDELERVYWNIKQERLEDREDRCFLEIPGVEYRRYFWDDCDCGAESAVHAKDCRKLAEHAEWNSRRLKVLTDPPENPITKEEIQAAVDAGSDPQDFVMANVHRYFSPIHFGGEREEKWLKENPHPPCTCGAEESWEERDYHLQSCSPQQPNFVFGEVRVSWYKRMGRGMSVNVDWEPNVWAKWLDAVLQRLNDWETVNSDAPHHTRGKKDATDRIASAQPPNPEASAPAMREKEDS